MLNYIVVPVAEDPVDVWGCCWNLDYCSQITSMLVPAVNNQNTTLWPNPICDFWVGVQRPSWMNEWVGPDINVVGPLEIPPSDEFSMSESSHLFGKSSWLTTHRITAGESISTAVLWALCLHLHAFINTVTTSTCWLLADKIGSDISYHYLRSAYYHKAQWKLMYVICRYLVINHNMGQLKLDMTMVLNAKLGDHWSGCNYFYF